MNKLMTHLAASVLALSLTFSSGSILAADKKAVTAKPKASAQQPQKAPLFLFVIDAKQGEIIKESKGQYHLVLKHADMNHVIKFSDRPNRIVQYITGEQLKSLWKVGKDSFEKDPPNAVLSGAGIQTQIIILNGIHVTKDTVRFPISVSQQERKAIGTLRPGSIAHVVLTIDRMNNDSCGWGSKSSDCPGGSY